MNKYDYSIHYRNWHDSSPEHHKAMSEYMARQISDWLPISLNSEILDVGCGFGFALGGLRQLGYDKIKGLEQSPEQAEVCRKAGFDVEVTNDTITWLKNNPGKFDGILLFDVLEHVPADVQIDFVRALFIALRPKGKLLLTVPNANAILASRWRYIDYTHHSSFTEYSIAFILENAGFSKLIQDRSKGLGPFPRWALRNRKNWMHVRKWIVRWCWLQVFIAEQPSEPIENISFELNLKCLAEKE